MNCDLFRLAQDLKDMGLNRAAEDVLQKILSCEHDRVDVWQLLWSITDSSSQQQHCIAELCRLLPDDELWHERKCLLEHSQAHIALETETEFKIDDADVVDDPATAVNLKKPTVAESSSAVDEPAATLRGRFRPSLGTRLAVWSAVLALVAVIAMIWYQGPSAELVAEFDRVPDLLWFMRQAPAETPERPSEITILAEQMMDVRESLSNATFREQKAISLVSDQAREDMKRLSEDLRLIQIQLRRLTENVQPFVEQSKSNQKPAGGQNEPGIDLLIKKMDQYFSDLDASLEAKITVATAAATSPVTGGEQPETQNHR